MPFHPNHIELSELHRKKGKHLRAVLTSGKLQMFSPLVLFYYMQTHIYPVHLLSVLENLWKICTIPPVILFHIRTDWLSLQTVYYGGSCECFVETHCKDMKHKLSPYQLENICQI